MRLNTSFYQIITGLSLHRATFDPIDRDNLSPLAVYDLSKQLSEPIRVFGGFFVVFSPRVLFITSLVEPCPSRITKIKRLIHESVSLSTYLVFTLIKSCLGFTLHDNSYLAVTFGDTFAVICAQLSRSIHPLNVWVLESARLIARLCACLVLLPLVIFFKAAVFVQSFLFLATRSALALLVSLLVTVGNTFLSLLCLPWKTQIMVLVLSWITLADFLTHSRNP